MEHLLNKYLSNHYVVDGEVGAIYYINTKDEIGGINLLEEIKTIFGLDKNDTHFFVRKWVNKVNNTIDMDWFWKSTSIALELMSVSVQANQRALRIVE